MRLIITAFEPFGGFETNSSLVCLNRINDDSIIKIVLPVSFPDAYETLKPSIKDCDFIILLGMAANRKMISIEERAKNILSFKIPDNSGNTISNKPIDDSQKEYIYSTVNIDKLIAYINKEKMIIYKSSDAGEFICNFLYYKVLNEHPIPSLFIHIPNYQTENEYKELENFMNKLIEYIKGEYA